MSVGSRVQSEMKRTLHRHPRSLRCTDQHDSDRAGSPKSRDGYENTKPANGTQHTSNMLTDFGKRRLSISPARMSASIHLVKRIRAEYSYRRKEDSTTACTGKRCLPRHRHRRLISSRHSDTPDSTISCVNEESSAGSRTSDAH